MPEMMAIMNSGSIDLWSLVFGLLVFGLWALAWSFGMRNTVKDHSSFDVTCPYHRLNVPSDVEVSLDLNV